MSTLVTATHVVEQDVYWPQQRPGYTAWVSLFQFGNGELGIAFNEIRRGKRTHFEPPTLEFGESMALPYRTCIDVLPASNRDLRSEYVYLKSGDAGTTWVETGRCEVDTRHCYTVGYPDGRMVRLIGTQAYCYERGVGRHGATVEESHDGGSTWTAIASFLQGYFFYGHKFKKLRDGGLIVAGPILPSFGPDGERETRQTELPNMAAPMQTAFMHSPDGGVHWSGPHYILPGIEAWEPDFVELPDGNLLFINCTVQAGLATRQVVRRYGDTFVNGPVFRIMRGAADETNPQSGITPETVALLPDGLIVGARRGSNYVCSFDLGENWCEIENAPQCLYQPMMEVLPDGTCLTAWHRGSDSRFGEYDMSIGTHAFRVEGRPPRATRLTVERELSADNNQYVNVYRARLTAGEAPLAGRTVRFWFSPLRNSDNTVRSRDVRAVGEAHDARTDADGVARVELPELDAIPAIHYAYLITAEFIPADDDQANGSCEGPLRMAYAMTSARNNPANYPAYFITHGLLMITPATAEAYPELLTLVENLNGRSPDMSRAAYAELLGDTARAGELLAFLEEHHIVQKDADGTYRWYRCTFCPSHVLAEIRVCELQEFFV